ncbi:(2Fe-2S) ferredoxin [Deinococcus metalli]|uniref:Ferredoxin n=1 Tax=Deinococcus metalli TaxID=1141878 RepID=A0A7W8NPU0_9DEIO|nr:(2Fe-2S) ferredoxin domain-containing protein [Deinococcus metalli]MBB5376130.1 (2Fe-2S) ferredoxin [Deinococcus metalli]GHF40570.1 ferredoxin [Deinococcus metalli]
MAPLYFKTSGHLLVCTGPNCTARGSGLLYRALWNHLERHSLAYYKRGGSLRLTESGCLGSCSFGPSMCVYRQRAGGLEEGWYAAVDVPLAARIAQAVHEGTDLPQEHKYGPT